MTSRSIFPPNCGRIFFSCSRNPIMGPHWKWQRNISMVSDDSPFVAIRNCSFCGFSGDASNLQVQIKVSMTTNAPCDSLLISIPWLSPGSISLPFRSAGKTLRTMRNYPEAVWKNARQKWQYCDANTIFICCRCCGTSPHPLNIPHNDRPRQTEESLQVIHTLHRSPNSPLLNFRTEITGWYQY